MRFVLIHAIIVWTLVISENDVDNKKKMVDMESYFPQYRHQLSPDFIDDIKLTNLRVIEKVRTSSEVHSRKKRQMVDFSHILWNKWELPIHVQIDSAFTNNQNSMIQAALTHWETETCISFLDMLPSSGPYLRIIRNDPSGICWSHIGLNVTSGPQLINFDDSCFINSHMLGNQVHEIGHAIGLVHEHTRPDRDQFVTIVHDNIQPGMEINFALKTTLNNNILESVPYDYSSLMHYLPWAFSINDELTITARDTLYTQTMTNLFGLTFYDAKAVNMEYCSEICTSSMTCERGGYQDPNDCENCRCLAGFTGKHCELDDPGAHGHLPGCADAGAIEASVTEEMCIDVSMFHGSGSPDDVLSCNWRIFTDASHAIGFWINDMSINCNRACISYLEVRYKDSLLTRGPRFCCSQPDLQIPIDGSRGNFLSSDGNEILLNFVDNFRFLFDYTPGFQICFKAMLQCRIDEEGTLRSSNDEVTPLSAGQKHTVVSRGSGDDICKVKVVVVTNKQGRVSWAAVSVGKHPHKANKYHRNFAIDRHGQLGVWQRGPTISAPEEIVFPYAGYSDGDVYVDVSSTGSGYRLQISCGTGLGGEQLVEFQYGAEANKDVILTFYSPQQWNGSCF